MVASSKGRLPLSNTLFKKHPQKQGSFSGTLVAPSDVIKCAHAIFWRYLVATKFGITKSRVPLIPPRNHRAQTLFSGSSGTMFYTFENRV